MIVLHFALPLNPEPWAIGPVGVTNKGGKPRGFVGQNQQLRNYQDAVQDELRKILTRSSDFPLQNMKYELYFMFWRRLDTYKTESGRASSRNLVDSTNMQKALEDALQKVLIDNDRNVVRIGSEIREQEEFTAPGIVVSLRADTRLLPMSLDWIASEEFIRGAMTQFDAADRFIFNNEV